MTYGFKKIFDTIYKFLLHLTKHLPCLHSRLIIIIKKEIQGQLIPWWQAVASLCLNIPDYFIGRFWNDERFNLITDLPTEVECDTRLFLMWAKHKNCIVPATTVISIPPTLSFFYFRSVMREMMLQARN